MSSKDFISQTLALAKKGKGKVAPNPMVGCVITKKGRLLVKDGIRNTEKIMLR